MFGRSKNKSVIVVDDCIYLRRNGKVYKQLSFWENGIRYSTIIKDNITPPAKGTTISRELLNSWKAT